MKSHACPHRRALIPLSSLILLALATGLLVPASVLSQGSDSTMEICGSASPPAVQISWLEAPDEESSVLLSAPQLTLVLANNTERLVKVLPELVFDRGRGPSKRAIPELVLAPNHQRSLVVNLTDDGSPVDSESTQGVIAHLSLSTEEGDYLGQTTTESLYFFAEASGGVTALGAAAMRQHLKRGKLPEARRLGTPEDDEDGVTQESVRYFGPEELAATFRQAISLSLPTIP